MDKSDKVVLDVVKQFSTKPTRKALYKMLAWSDQYCETRRNCRVCVFYNKASSLQETSECFWFDVFGELVEDDAGNSLDIASYSFQTCNHLSDDLLAKLLLTVMQFLAQVSAKKEV